MFSAKLVRAGIDSYDVVIGPDSDFAIRSVGIGLGPAKLVSSTPVQMWVESRRRGPSPSPVSSAGAVPFRRRCGPIDPLTQVAIVVSSGVEPANPLNKKLYPYLVGAQVSRLVIDTSPLPPLRRTPR